MKTIILALLPGLEEETSEDFDRTLRIVEGFKHAIRPAGNGEHTDRHSSGDAFFWQCFFLASITSHSRRSGALAYLVRCLPSLGSEASSKNDGDYELKKKLSSIVTSPEPGLLLRCFASGLSDEHLLIQRGFLDLLVSHLPLNSNVIQTRVKPDDLELLLKAAVGVVTRREMGLNRRLWSWLLGPELTHTDQDQAAGPPSSPSADHQTYMASRTTYFEEFGLQPLIKALLEMIKGSSQSSASERARPYRICLSLMDRWEIGGLIVPEVFLPIVDSVRQFKNVASTTTEFNEVLRSASVFFDGIESGLIYGELVSLLAQAMGLGSIKASERRDKLDLVSFMLNNFNVREEEMITVHAPLCCLSALSMLEDSKDRLLSEDTAGASESLSSQVLNIAITLLDLVPERAFPEQQDSSQEQNKDVSPSIVANTELLKRIRTFYVNDQGNVEGTPPPFSPLLVGEMILQKAAHFVSDAASVAPDADLDVRVRILILAIHKTPKTYRFDESRLLRFLHGHIGKTEVIPFSTFSAALHLSTQLYYVERIRTTDLSKLVFPLVRHAWAYLSASEPKYHVEAVRSLWQLQSALTIFNRDIEAALSALLISQSSDPNSLLDKGRALGVLWSHTLQDNASGNERRGSRTPMLELKASPRLSGADNYEVMLTQPLFLILDSLLDNRTQSYLAVKSWLNSMLGIDR